jgi:CTP synthase (UTP-ammonia lyase)
VNEKLAGLDGIVLPADLVCAGRGHDPDRKILRVKTRFRILDCASACRFGDRVCAKRCGPVRCEQREFDENSPHKVIDFMPDQMLRSIRGHDAPGTYPCKVVPGSLLEKCYAQPLIHERHRHRYEFNNDYRERLTDAGLVLSGVSPDERIVETVELKDPPVLHRRAVPSGFKSRPNARIRCLKVCRGLVEE